MPFRIFVLSMLGLMIPALGWTEPAIELAGTWQLKLDPQDEGIENGWFEDAFENGDPVWLPGAPQNQGYGDPITAETEWTGSIFDDSYYTEDLYEPYRQPGNVKIPFMLQPPRRYLGAAWYRRAIEIPQNWAGKRVVLTLERAHWATELWVDGEPLGTGDSLSVPHTYDLTPVVFPGGEHILTLRVDNRMQYELGVNSHSVSDQTQTNWNGVVGSIALTPTEPVWIEHVAIHPDVAQKQVRVAVTIGDQDGEHGYGDLTLAAQSYNAGTPHTIAPITEEREWKGRSSIVEMTLPLGDGMQLWDEFSPALYRLSVTFTPKASAARPSRWQGRFGMREFKTDGTQFTINGRPLFLRGTLDCAIFPHTGFPPTDTASWRKIFRTVKDYGLNHVRFHSWCPPAAAFEAADELGIYLNAEGPSWANQGASVGNGAPVDAWLYQESERILNAYGNSPSFVMFSYGNEPAGPGGGGTYLGPWVDYFKELDPRRVYTAAAGWPAIEQSEFHIRSEPRLHQWKDDLNDRLNSQPPATVADHREFIAQHKIPVVSHEIGQWCVFPNFDEMTQYTGALKPKNFEIFRDLLANNHMADQARDFLMASGRLQVLAYKEEIETALRTPGFGGFQLLGLQDFSGQGTALVGVVDAFWNPKPYVDAAEFRRFCAPTVLLARLPKMTWTTGEKLTAGLEIANFGPVALGESTVRWRLVDADGTLLLEDMIEAAEIATGRLTALGAIEADLSGIAAPSHLKLTVALEGTEVVNDWDLFLYAPKIEAEPGEVHIARELDDATLEHLAAGGRALLLLPPGRVNAPSVIGFSPVFWNTSWTSYQQPHTLGLRIDPAHPLFAEFPTEGHTNWQWWDPIAHSSAMVLDGLPATLRPLIQPIDTWFFSRRLGLAFEARLNGGKLLVCSIDFEGLGDRPASAQLYKSMLGYMNSDAFDPLAQIRPEHIEGLLAESE